MSEVIRTMYYYGTLEHFRAFMMRMRRHNTFKSSTGEMLKLREVQYSTSAFFAVNVTLEKQSDDMFHRGTIEVYEDINGCTINFVDGYGDIFSLDDGTYSPSSLPKIGQTFVELTDSIIKEARLVPTQSSIDSTSSEQNDLKQEEIESLEKQYRTYQRSLLRLQEQEAEHAGRAPAELLNQIDKVQENIERIKARLQELKS